MRALISVGGNVEKGLFGSGGAANIVNAMSTLSKTISDEDLAKLLQV